MMSPDRVAQCAQLAMLFELSSGPKPGNVDRCHDFPDISFYHFLVSAVSVYPVFRRAASGQGCAGSLILEGAQSWRRWSIGSNTHFGSLVLMIPLAMAASRSGNLREALAEVLDETTGQDAVDFYRAFQLTGARVVDVEEFSLKDPKSAGRLYQEGRTLQALMLLSQGHDLVAREWSTSYERSFLLAGRLAESIGKCGLNDGIVRTYLEALAETPDTLVQAKFGMDKARQISLRASEALQDATLEAARQMDEELLAQDINPGSTADLIAASLFIALLMDLRF
ncbi:2-(5''-triphosphoribosyl)-3'-dephosphocoenzyme-A synthase [uncultured archaeon]|nr:2-(5''-triphosphoribosyl)-3'-dephosphocoenzyme-A synthase [uncultured archaeon]